MKFTLDKARQQFKLHVKGFSYCSYAESPDMTAERLVVDGWHGLSKSLLSTRCFHVLEGLGTFVVAGQEYSVAPGDVVVVPRNTPHDFTGKMILFVVHSPADHPDFNVDLE